MLNRINLILKAKNITSKQFAEEIGVQPSGLSHILSGRNNPSLDFVMKVMRRYPEIDINWLMFGKGEMYAGQPIRLNVPPLTTESVAAPEPTLRAEPDLFSSMEEPAVPIAPAPVPVSAPTPIAAPVAATVAPAAVPSAPVAATVAPAAVPSAPVAAPIAPVAPVAAPAPAAAAPVTPIAENRKNESSEPAVPEFPIPAKQKKIVKFVVLYDDRTFSEYYPE